MRKSERSRTLSLKAQLNAGVTDGNEGHLPVVNDPVVSGSTELACKGRRHPKREVAEVGRVKDRQLTSKVGRSSNGRKREVVEMGRVKEPRKEGRTSNGRKLDVGGVDSESASKDGQGLKARKLYVGGVDSESTSKDGQGLKARYLDVSEVDRKGLKAKKRGLIEMDGRDAGSQPKKSRLDSEGEPKLGDTRTTTNRCCQFCDKGVCSLLPGRRVQIHLLTQLLTGERLPPCLYVHGSNSCGKSLVLTTLLSSLQLSHAIVNCQECYCPEILFTQILYQLSDHTHLDTTTKCHTLHKFLLSFKQLPCMKNHQPICIVLDHADQLRDDPLLLAALQKLSELSGSCKVCVVMVSALTVGYFFNKMELVTNVVPVYFPPYSREDTIEIMAMDCPAHQPLPFFRTFVQHILNVFQSVCLDLSELRSLCCSLYPRYIQPVERGEVTYQESRYLWRCIQPYFKTIMNRVYLTEISCEENDLVLQLSFYAKYLLLASYLASNNPSKTDRRFFSKLRQPKVHKARKGNSEASEQLLGPKDFSLDRMMAIFHSIVTGLVVPVAQLYTQVSSLVRLQLLTQNSRDGALDLPRYKCLMGLALAKQLAREVGFNLIHHLHDFNS